MHVHVCVSVHCALWVMVMACVCHSVPPPPHTHQSDPANWVVNAPESGILLGWLSKVSCILASYPGVPRAPGGTPGTHCLCMHAAFPEICENWIFL